MHDATEFEDAITGINVTPLVDITLVLLIIFMVTARIISDYSVGVNLPQASVAAQSAKQDNIYITISKNKQVLIDNTPIEISELTDRIRILKEKEPNANLIIRADRDVLHGEVVDIMNRARAEGITQLGIAVEYEGK